MKELSNDLVRDMFNNFYTERLQPNLKLLTQDMGISYFYFVKWRKGKIDMSERKLVDVVEYIRNQLSVK